MDNTVSTRDNDAGCCESQASINTNASTRGKNTSALMTKLLRRMRIVKPSVEPSYGTIPESKFHQACISESTPTSVVNSTDENPPQSLFDFFGVLRDSEWGKILSDRYKGLSTESPLEARMRAGPLELNVQNPSVKWPLTHKERIDELQGYLEDPSQFRYYRDISAAIDFHRAFNGNDLCSLDPVYFHEGRQVDANERSGLCWMEGPLSMKSSSTAGSRAQNSTQAMSTVSASDIHLPTTHHAVYCWGDDIKMYEVMNSKTP